MYRSRSRNSDLSYWHSSSYSLDYIFRLDSSSRSRAISLSLRMSYDITGEIGDFLLEGENEFINSKIFSLINEHNRVSRIHFYVELSSTLCTSIALFPSVSAKQSLVGIIKNQENRWSLKEYRNLVWLWRSELDIW